MLSPYRRPRALARLTLAGLLALTVPGLARADVYATPHCTLAADAASNFITIVPPGGTLDDALVVPLVDLGGAQTGDLVQLDRGLEGKGPHARVVTQNAPQCASVRDLLRQIEAHHASGGHGSHPDDPPHDHAHHPTPTATPPAPAKD